MQRAQMCSAGCAVEMKGIEYNIELPYENRNRLWGWREVRIGDKKPRFHECAFILFANMR